MKQSRLLLLFLFSCHSVLCEKDNERTPLLERRGMPALTFPNQPQVTFRWLLEHVPGRETTVWPVTAFLTGTMMAVPGYQTCSLDDCPPVSAAMVSVGTALWFYTGSCVFAACVLPDKPKQK